MEPEKNIPESDTEHAKETEQQPFRSSYSRGTRIRAWLGVAFMIFLVIMYTYSLASGKIMMF